MAAHPEAVTLALQLAAAWIMDLTLGEMPNRWHPVVYMGRLTRKMRDFALHWLTGQKALLMWGTVMALSIPALFVGGTVLLLAMARGISPLGEWILGIYLLKSTFAVRALKEAAFEVRDALAAGDLAQSRWALRSLCSRDASSLSPSDITSATIGSLAENLSDSIVAPLFFFALFGIPGAVFYRTVNTMDAIIGYRDRYEHLGKAAARLDDLVNLIPARLTALLLLVTGAVHRQGVRQGWITLRRDHRKTPSPNGGWPMATMAGLLRVEVSKIGVYQLGEPVRPLSATMIDQAWILAYGAAWIWTVTVGTLILAYGGLLW